MLFKNHYFSTFTTDGSKKIDQVVCLLTLGLPGLLPPILVVVVGDYLVHVSGDRPLLVRVGDVRHLLHVELGVALGTTDLGAIAERFGTSPAGECPGIRQ